MTVLTNTEAQEKKTVWSSSLLLSFFLENLVLGDLVQGKSSIIAAENDASSLGKPACAPAERSKESPPDPGKCSLANLEELIMKLWLLYLLVSLIV